MSINAIFNTASSSIVAQRVATEIIGENIANVNTPGYSRQRANLETAPVTNSNGFPLGNGVIVATVQRFYDASLQKNLADSNSTLFNNQTLQSSLQQIEPIFNEMTGDGMGKAIQDFFDSWQGLSVNASGFTERQTVLTRSQALIDSFQQANDNLRTVQTNANRTLDSIAADITDKARGIATLNEQITRMELGGGPSSNELRDQRDILVQDLAKKTGVTFTEEKDSSLTITLPGGRLLVLGSKYSTVYTAAPLNPSQLDPNSAIPDIHIFATEVGNPPPAANSAINADLTSVIGGSGNTLGEIGAVLNIRSTIVPGYLEKLDELAYSLAYQVNTQHNKGWNLGSPSTVGGDFFNLTAGSSSIYNINTAGLNIGDAVSGPGVPAGAKIVRIDSLSQVTLDPPILHSVTGATFSFPSGNQTGNAIGIAGSSSVSGISLRVASANEIAAADANPLTSGTGNNGNALAIAGISNKSIQFIDGSKASIITTYNALVSTLGAEVLSVQNATTKSESFVKQLSNLRESVAGVSLDEELTNLIKYQKAFQGSAKLITTATDMMDTVLGLVR